MIINCGLQKKKNLMNSVPACSGTSNYTKLTYNIMTTCSLTHNGKCVTSLNYYLQVSYDITSYMYKHCTWRGLLEAISKSATSVLSVEQEEEAPGRLDDKCCLVEWAHPSFFLSVVKQFWGWKVASVIEAGESWCLCCLKVFSLS